MAPTPTGKANAAHTPWAIAAGANAGHCPTAARRSGSSTGLAAASAFRRRWQPVTLPGPAGRRAKRLGEGRGLRCARVPLMSSVVDETNLGCGEEHGQQRTIGEPADHQEITFAPDDREAA